MMKFAVVAVLIGITAAAPTLAPVSLEEPTAAPLTNAEPSLRPRRDVGGSQFVPTIWGPLYPLLPNAPGPVVGGWNYGVPGPFVNGVNNNNGDRWIGADLLSNRQNLWNSENVFVPRPDAWVVNNNIPLPVPLALPNAPWMNNGWNANGQQGSRSVWSLQ